jgi:hypothetical protein
MILSDIFPVLARFSRMTQKSAADVNLDAFFKERATIGDHGAAVHGDWCER